MAKASPLIRSFNAGEVSPLIEGRTDLDRYPASNRSLLNYVAAPQGPAIPRSGSFYMSDVYDHTKKSVLLPFVFSETVSYQMEFCEGRVRFHTEEGILTYTPVSATMVSTSPFKFTSAALTAQGAAVGSEVALSGFGNQYNLNGVVGKITAKSGDDYTINLTHPALAMLPTITVALVYHVVSPYVEADVLKLFVIQSLDVCYLLHPTKVSYKLKRYDTYNWVFEVLDYIDGPYLPVNETTTKITPSSRGIATPTMTTNTAPSGTCFGSSNSVNHEFYRAFNDEDAKDYWESNVNQTGIIGYQAAAPFVCDGYCIYMALDNANTSYTSKDYAPSTFTFEGSNDGVNYTILDRQSIYVLYDNNKSAFFKLKNSVAYSYYRLNIDTCTRNGTINPRVRSLVLRSTASTTITLTASSTTGINNDQGFKATDVGRLIRIKGTDNTWRSLKITGYTSPTVVTAQLLGEPFVGVEPVADWRMGYWSDTTGYPSRGCFYQDRLWLGGSTLYPDIFAGSVVGAYEEFTQTSDNGEVLDTHAVVGRLNSRRMSRIKWMVGSDKGLLLGTGSQEYVLTAADGAGKTITPGNAKVQDSSSRGSSDTEPVPIDNQVLYVQRSGRTIREFAFSYEADGYKSPSMSMLASHLGVSPFVKMVYAAEPYSIVWMLRTDGSVVGLTYNRDENVVGWHRHDFAGGIVESMSVIPATDQLQDTLWLVVRRTVNGQTRRYVERLTRFWDFDMTIEDAHFVDCGLRYTGAPITEVYGLQHLEAMSDVYGLADNIPVGPLVVSGGKVVLDQAASNIVIGLGFEAQGETSRLENGAADGTAIGKVKRINNLSVNVWQSYGGEIGTWNEDLKQVEYAPLEYPAALDEVETINLFSGIIGPINTAPGYEKKGSVFFRRLKSSPLPFNIVALMPQINTQDR